jgi:acyl carrier protein
MEIRVNMQNQPKPAALSRGAESAIAAPCLRWMNVATSALILAGFVAFLGLVVSLFYLGLEGIADEYISAWFKALWYTLAGILVLSADLAALRFRLVPSRQAQSDAGSQRRGWSNLATSGFVLVGLATIFAMIAALAYMQLLDILGSGDEDINPLWYMAFWYVPVGVGGAALSAGFACIRFRLFLTLTWIFAAGFFMLVILASLLNQTLESAAAAYFDPFSIRSVVLCLLAIAALIWYLRNALQQPSQGGHRRLALGATTFGTLALMLFAIGIWVFGRETPTHGSAETSVTQPSARPVTWKEVRSIIAKVLNVPEQRVTPGVRLREDLHAQVNDIEQILTGFEKKFGIVTQPNDDEVILTAEDAFKFAQSPDAFRDQPGIHADSHLPGSRSRAKPLAGRALVARSSQFRAGALVSSKCSSCAETSAVSSITIYKNFGISARCEGDCSRHSELVYAAVSIKRASSLWSTSETRFA